MEEENESGLIFNICSVPGIDEESSRVLRRQRVLVMVLHLPLAACVNSDKLLNLCELQCPHGYLRRLCEKENRIHVPMAHSKCSENVGIFSCCHYYHYHLIFKPAS